MTARTTTLATCTAAMLLAFSGQAVATPLPVTTVALTGAQTTFGPQLAPDITFANTAFGAASINSSGDVVFASNLAGNAPVEAASGVWKWTRATSSLGIAARQGDAAPSIPGGVVGVFSNAAVNIGEGGHVVIRNTITGLGIANGNNQALFVRGPVGPLALVARQTNSAAGGGTFAGINVDVSVDSAGVVGFSGNLAQDGTTITAANDTGFWRASSQATQQLLLREGSAAPGIANAFYGTVSNGARVAASGRVSFGNVLTGTGVAPTNSTTRWAGSATSPTLVARNGMSAPGTPSTWASPGTIFNAGANAVAFSSTITTGGTVTGANDFGIWAGTESAVQLVAREGSPAFGVNNAIYGSSLSAVLGLNSSGQVVFRSNMTGTGVSPGLTDNAMWVGSANSLTLVARRGDTPSFFTDGARIQDLLSTTTVPVLNGIGQVAFLVPLAGTNVTAATDRAILAYDPVLGLMKVAREGDSILCGDGVTRTIRDLSFLGGNGSEGGVSSGLAGVAGQTVGMLTYTARFTDNSQGVFVVAIPAPGSALALVAGGLLARRRRRA